MGRFLIIAGSSAIGQATAQCLRGDGHEVLTTARPGSASPADYPLDATDFDAVDRVFASAGRLDGAVNCAGSLLLKPAHLTTREQYDATIAASLTTAFATVRAAGRHMPEGGSVVLISSAAARTGLASHDAIAAAKAGIIGLTLSAAATYAVSGLRINAVAPGLVSSPLTAPILANEASRKVSAGMHALNRFGTADDIARAIGFLLDPENSWITGQVIVVDGGLSSVRPKPRA